MKPPVGRPIESADRARIWTSASRRRCQSAGPSQLRRSAASAQECRPAKKRATRSTRRRGNRRTKSRFIIRKNQSICSVERKLFVLGARSASLGVLRARKQAAHVRAAAPSIGTTRPRPIGRPATPERADGSRERELTFQVGCWDGAQRHSATTPRCGSTALPRAALAQFDPQRLKEFCLIDRLAHQAGGAARAAATCAGRVPRPPPGRPRDKRAGREAR